MRHNGGMTEIVTIENERWRVGLVPATGGSVAFAQARVGGAWQDVLRPTPEESLGRPGETASYPLVPWSNRIRKGQLKWAGRTYQLRVNFADGTAIHGTGWDYPWAVVEQSPTRVVLELASREFYGVNFPWPFTARFAYELDGDAFTWTYGLTNDSHETFPGGFGHHPYFLRSVAGSDDAHLQLNCEQEYALVDAMPSAGPEGLRPAADFRSSRPVGHEFVDDCFTGRSSATLAVIEWPATLRVTLDADELLSHAVVYIPEGKPFFAVEPVSHCNDAFTLEDGGLHGTGLFLVQPGETKTASFTLTAADPS